mgnify:CR=1 FL=1
MRSIGIFGTSGFAREVSDIASAVGLKPIFITPSHSPLECSELIDDVIEEREIESCSIDFFSIGVGDNNLRKKIAGKYSESLNFINLIHPSATMGRLQIDKLEDSKGLIICAGVRLTNNISVGKFVICNLNATIGHDVRIDDFVNIAPGACVSGNVHLAECSYVGTGAVIRQGLPNKKVFLGAGSIIGANSTVIKDCEPGGIYVGSPCRRIK